MRKKLHYFVLLAIFTGNIAYSQYVEDTLTVNRTEEAPFIDGSISEFEWDTEEFDTIQAWGTDENELPHFPEEWDCFARYKMLWDEEYIYFLGVIVDDFVADKASLVSAVAPTWETDSWEFYIAPTLSKLASMEEMTQIRWSYANVNSEDASAGVVNGWSSGGFTVDDFGYAVRSLTEEGWILEASFELAPFAEKTEEGVLTEGSLIGWQITVSDNDGEEFRDWIGSWIADTQWDQADTLGILKLGSELTGSTIETGKTQAAEIIGIYPNPVDKEFHIKGNARVESIDVINSVGALVFRSTNVKNRIDVSDLQPGLYFVNAYSDNRLLKTLKFIKE